MTAETLTIHPYKLRETWVFDDPPADGVLALPRALLLLRPGAGNDLRACRPPAGRRESDLGTAGRSGNR